MEQFKYCSSMLTDVGYGTIRPPKDKCTSSWGDEVMNDEIDEKKGFREYCMLNSCTDDGLHAIANYNKFLTEWAQEVALFDEDTSLAQKRFISFKLYAKYRKRRSYHLDPMEGGHRKVGNIQANFCSPLDPERGCFSKPTSYTLAQFRQVGMIPAAGIQTSDITGAYNIALKEGSKSSGFFHATASVAVRYLINPEIHVPLYLDSCRIGSEALAREKRNSATKDPFVEIAIYASKFMGSMSDDALLYRPCLKKFSYRAENKFPGVVAKTKLSKTLTWKDDRGKIAEDIPLTDFLYSRTFENYCQDPFDEDNKQHFMQELEVPIMVDNDTSTTEQWEPNEDVKVKPPFFVSYESMAIDAGLGDKQRATTEMINKWCLLPIFIHILQAHKTNKSLVDTASDPDVTRLILYAMRHHVHNHGNINLSGHPCMWMIYELPNTPNLASGECQVIPASLYLTEIVNAALTTLHHSDIRDNNHQQTINPRRARLKEAVNEVSELLSSLNIYAHHPGLDKMIEDLGKNILHFVKNIFSFNCYQCLPSKIS